VFGIHGVGGIIGAIGTGVFTSSSLGGVGYADGVTMGGQVYSQIVAVLITIVWCGVVSAILYKIVDADRRPAPDAGSRARRPRPLLAWRSGLPFMTRFPARPVRAGFLPEEGVPAFLCLGPDFSGPFFCSALPELHCDLQAMVNAPLTTGG
jgi:hypothetical protein